MNPKGLVFVLGCEVHRTTKTAIRNEFRMAVFLFVEAQSPEQLNCLSYFICIRVKVE